MTAWRQELFCSSPAQLRALLPLLQRHQITAVNLPNKQPKGAELDDLLDRARLLRAVAASPASPASPAFDVCVHYAINQNTVPRDTEASYQRLEAFCRKLAALRGGCSLLLVSGSGPRKQLDSLRALERLAASPEMRGLQLPLAIAFNPYFPDEELQAEERQRLRRKLEAGRGMVEAVYLQAGSDTERLEQGLQHLEQVLDELDGRQQSQAAEGSQPREGERLAADGHPAKRRRTSGAAAAEGSGGSSKAADAAWQQQRPKVFGSLLVPSRKLLAQMKFRPWRGVFLSERYLSSVEAADDVTRQVLRVYARHGVQPLVETEVATDEHVQHVRQLLASAAEEQPGPPALPHRAA